MAVARDDIRMRVVMDCSKADCKAPLSGFRKGVAEADRGVASLGKGLKSVGALAAGAFAVAGVSKFVGAMGEAVGMASKLDKGLREIGTLVGGLTKGELASMKVELEELSVASGQAIEPLVKARYDIVSAGFSDAADAALLLEKSARLAVGGVTDVATAADLTTTILNAYGKGASEVGTVHDDLFTIVRNGKTDLSQLGSNMGALIATAGPLGVALDEVGAGMSALTSRGQATAIAATALSAAIQTLSNPNKELVAALKAAGVETDNLIEAGGGLAGALELVQKASDKTGIAVNKLITREEAQRAIMPLLSSAAEKFSADLASMADNTGAADAAFDGMSKSSDVLKDRMERAFESAQRAIGGAIAESEGYRQLLVDLRDGASKFAKAIEANSQVIENSLSISAIAMKATGLVVATVATESVDVVGSLASTTAQAFGSVMPKGLEVFGNKWQATGGIIAGAADTINDAIITIVAGAKLAGNQLITLNDIVAKTLTFGAFGSPTAAYNEGISRAASIEKEWGEKIAAQQEQYMKQLKSLHDAFNPEKQAAGQAELKKETEELLKAIDSLSSGSKNAAGSVNNLGGAAADLERKLQSAEEWYAKENEVYEGMYEARKEHERGVENLTLLYEKSAIGLNDFNAGITKANNKASERYMFGQFLGYDYVYDENGDPAPRGYNRDRSGAASGERDAWSLVASGLNDVQDTLRWEGIEVRGLSSFAEAARSYGAYLNPRNGQDPNPANLYNAIGAAGVGAGQMVGGRVGNIISSTASMGAAGATLGAALAAGGGPYGAAIGAVIGLVSSLFSNDDEERRARRDEARQEAFNAVQDMALSGGPLSAELMRRSDWSWQNFSGLRHTQDIADEFGVWWPERLMADNGVEGIADRQEMIMAIDNLLLSIKGFTEAGFSQSLDKLNIKYEYLAEKSHNLALVEEARLTDLIQLVTGINAETVAGSVSGALTAAAASGRDAAEIFAESFTLEILDGVANAAVSQMVTSTIMPILEGPLAQIARSMTAGGEFNASALAEAVSLAKSAADSVAPVVEELYAAFDASGMWAAAMGEWSGLVTEVTGASAASLTATILQSFSRVESEGGSIGNVFIETFTGSVQEGLQRFAAGRLVEEVLSSMMAPVLEQVAAAVDAAQGISEVALSSALQQIGAVAEQAAPHVEKLYNAFRGATTSRRRARSYSGGRAAASDRSADGLAEAIEGLERYRKTLFAGQSRQFTSLGSLQTQQSAVSSLVAEALYSADRGDRAAAVRNLPGAADTALKTALDLATDPLEYSREVARMSNELERITSGETTLADLQRELRLLRKENAAIREELEIRNETGAEVLSVMRDIQGNGVVVQKEEA